MQVQRVSNGVLRLTVRQEISGVKVDFAALISEGDYSLRVQSIRLESDHRMVEFRLSERMAERAHSFSPAVFYPDRSVPATDLIREETQRATKPVITPPTVFHKPEIGLHSDASMLVRRIEAYYILHRTGACRGVPVTISEEAEGVRVSGQGQPYGSSTSYFTSVAGISDILGALSDIRASNKRFLEGAHAQPASADGSNSTKQLLLDADALETLASSFNQSQIHRLPGASLRLFQLMVEEHAESLSKTLETMAGPARVQTGTREGSELQVKNTADWRSAVKSVAEDVQMLASSEPLDRNALQSNIENLIHAVADLNAQAQLQLSRDRQSASIRKSQRGN
jgi:hypothetical protein